jgi:hypothetical protein
VRPILHSLFKLLCTGAAKRKSVFWNELHFASVRSAALTCFEVLTLVKVKMLSGFLPCSVVGGHHCFGVNFCHHFQDESEVGGAGYSEMVVLTICVLPYTERPKSKCNAGFKLLIFL